MKKIVCLVALVCAAFLAKSQVAVHLNLNEYYPLGNSLKTGYPMLWYDGENDRGVLLGGFGLGLSYTKALKTENRSLRLQLNAQRSRFYDEPIVLLDNNGQLNSNGIIGINTHYNTTLLGLYSIAINRAQLGAGLGLKGVFLSKTDYGKISYQGAPRDLNVKNTSLAPVSLFLPIEFGYSVFKDFGVALRSEFYFTPTSRIYKKERGLAVFLEFSYALSSKKENK